MVGTRNKKKKKTPKKKCWDQGPGNRRQPNRHPNQNPTPHPQHPPKKAQGRRWLMNWAGWGWQLIEKLRLPMGRGGNGGGGGGGGSHVTPPKTKPNENIGRRKEKG